MNLFKSFSLNKKFNNSVIAIGNFDGVHKGHQKVLMAAKDKAKKEKKKFGILTFDPMPMMFFQKRLLNHKIQNKNQKLKILKSQKIDFLIEKKFNKTFSKTSYNDFIQNIIFKKLNCKFLFVSQNFRFGKNREGDVKKLKHFEKKYSYKTIVTPALKINNKIVSSTLIRSLIEKGKVHEVKKFLGRNWCIEGKVQRGFQRGRKIGFPTCNLSLGNYKLPKFGVYDVKIKFKKFIKRGIANIGIRPTFNGKRPTLEVNIFGFNRNIYKKEIEIEFLKFIRKERKFKGIEDLKKQIKKDIKKIKK